MLFVAGLYLGNNDIYMVSGVEPVWEADCNAAGFSLFFANLLILVYLNFIMYFLLTAKPNQITSVKCTSLMNCL